MRKPLPTPEERNPGCDEDMPMLMMATNRKVSRGQFIDQVQSGFDYDYLYGYDGGEPGADGFIGRGKRGFELALMTEMHRLRDELGIKHPKVGIYLHGYNNDWHESIDELYDLHHSLTPIVGYEPILVGFSWPSAGDTSGYLSDREQVRDSVPAFTRFLKDIHSFLLKHERECFCTSYCIAHSMGNYLLRKGMEYLSDHLGTPVGRVMFSESIMLAPDISSHDLELDGKGRYIGDFSRRVHTYYSPYDRALKASSAKRFGANRLGRHGPEEYEEMATNIVAINAQGYANSASVEEADLRDRRGNRVSIHSSHRYHPKILADVEKVMSSVDRNLIPNRIVDRRLPDGSPDPDNHFVLGEEQ